jgi:hypothetical protein
MAKAKFITAEWTVGQNVNRSKRNTWDVYSDDDTQWRRARDMHLKVEFKKRRSI